MGSVWAARNELTDRDFAVKFLHPKLADNKEALHRFFLEARACGQIKHPAVVDVYDMGQAEDGSPYLVMEMLEGEGFDQRLSRSGCFRPSEAAAWIAFIARGLEEAHVRGLVHRDLKPGNIFFALDDRGDVIPKILDFGVSKATSPRDIDFVKTSTGAVLGSPAYMSPEQARGDLDIDGRSDVWSLGVILYEALTGKAPFDAPNYNALMLAIITRPHRPVAEVAPGVPLELSQLVDVTLAKEASGRVHTARELADRLEAIATRITDSPIQIMGLRTPTLMGGQTPLPRSTTQNAWSDGRQTTGRRGSTSVLIAAVLLSLTVLVGGAVVFLQSRGPTVAVAGRSHAALQTALGRLGGQMDQLRADALAAQVAQTAQAAQKAKDQQLARPAVDPDDLPAARGARPDGSPLPRSTAAPPVLTAAPSSTAKVAPQRPHKADPQSAVPGPGF
jgi:eukaryotic-like serine/threonine-protein kinase